jgi:hypothetical protein
MTILVDGTVLQRVPAPHYDPGNGLAGTIRCPTLGGKSKYCCQVKQTVFGSRDERNREESHGSVGKKNKNEARRPTDWRCGASF